MTAKKCTKKRDARTKLLFLAPPCKGIQDSLRFWIPRSGLRILITGFQIFFSETWIPDSNCLWDSGFLQLFFGFQGPGFRIPRRKISKIPESEFPYIGRLFCQSKPIAFLPFSLPLPSLLLKLPM